MKNFDTAWVVVRAFGLYFLAQAFLQTFSITLNAMTLSAMYDIANNSSSVELIEKAKSNITRDWSYLVTSTIQFIFFVFLSFYCLRKGKLVHRLLTYRAGLDENT